MLNLEVGPNNGATQAGSACRDHIVEVNTLATTYWDPFREMDRIFSAMANTTRNSANMPMDLTREGEKYLLTIDMPGIDPGSIDVSVEDLTLTVRAERSTDRPDAEWLLRERPSGAIARQVTVGRGLALDKIEASYTDGVLTLIIPVSEEAKPRRIEVTRSGSSTHPTIEQVPAS